MVARIVKLHLILLHETNGLLCYKVNPTSVNLFSDFTITENRQLFRSQYAGFQEVAGVGKIS